MVLDKGNLRVIYSVVKTNLNDIRDILSALMVPMTEEELADRECIENRESFILKFYYNQQLLTAASVEYTGYFDKDVSRFIERLEKLPEVLDKEAPQKIEILQAYNHLLAAACIEIGRIVDLIDSRYLVPKINNNSLKSQLKKIDTSYLFYWLFSAAFVALVIYSNM